jgi:glutamate 5-kinase
MARTVIKLGSAIVATDEGELRAELLARICAAVAAARAGGDELAIVTSGAIARGTRPDRAPDRDRGAAGGQRCRPGPAVPGL